MNWRTGEGGGAIKKQGGGRGRGAVWVADSGGGGGGAGAVHLLVILYILCNNKLSFITFKHCGPASLWRVTVVLFSFFTVAVTAARA